MVDALVSVALEHLVRLATDEVRLLRKTREEVNQLSSTFTSIQVYLFDAEMRQIKDKAVQDWLQKLKYVAYEMDDLVDEWKFKLQQLSNNNTCHVNSVRNFFTHSTCFQHLVMRHKIGKKIKKMNKKLDQIANEKNKFKFQQITMPVEAGDGRIFSNFVGRSRGTHSWVDESDVFGREDEKKKIKNKLINEAGSMEGDIPVISIVGTGGFGKTTLSQIVFNDVEVHRHFQEHIWVCISDEFDVQNIIKKIVEVLKEETPNVNELEALQKVLSKNLKKKRFLLVLDDVWNDKSGEWEKLIDILKKCGEKGSRILVTTRLMDVAEAMASTYTCQLGPLSLKDCLYIFKKVVFQGTHESEHLELMEIGKKIVEKCKGMPLAVKCVAGALRIKRRRREWESLHASPVWDWEEAKEYIQPALLLSYYHLSPQLKQCFRYCCIYPKDYEIEKKQIVNLWVAQGYIPLDGNMEAEDIGEKYFEELLARSLFQEPQVDEYENIKKCKMHDLVHDLAQFVSKGEFDVINVSKDNPSPNVGKTRHCNLIASTDPEACLNALIDAENLRTFVSLGFIHNIHCLIEQLQYVRVLKIHGSPLMQLPKSFSKLVHLRYVDLSYTWIEALPDSIGGLWNLEYLRMPEESMIVALPESFMKLGNLRHLKLRIKILPMSFAKLGNLRYLDLWRSEFEEFPEPVTKLGNLRHLNLSDTKIKALPESIEKLGNLRHLDLERSRVEEISEAIGKLKQLRYLNLSQTRIKELPESITGLSHLQVLDVSLCDQLSRLPEGIHKLTGLKQLMIRFAGLETLPSGIGRLTSLRRLGKFIVTADTQAGGSSNLSELRYLNHLGGLLEITNLDKVGGREEAENAELENKEFLDELWLSWTMYFSYGDDLSTLLHKWEEDSNQRRAEDVLQVLRPHPNVNKYLIYSYPGSKIPCWSQDGSLSCMKSLSLEYWPNCKQLSLSALGNLPQLQYLSIKKMPKLRKIGGEFFGSKNGFPKLEELVFLDMENWEEWEPLLLTGEEEEEEEEEGEAIATLPRLRELQIIRCCKLKELPPIFSEALVDVIISDCPVLSGTSIPPSIEKLLLWDSEEFLSRLPSLPKLKRLELHGFGELTELPNNLIRYGELRELQISSHCRKLEESCKTGGDQWPKIAHIPRITIGGLLGGIGGSIIQWKE